MTSTTINTQKANEIRINGNCKGVRCLTDGKFYPGMKFAAKEAGVSPSSMSYAIKHKTPCKGKRYAWESETEENVMEMGRQLSEMETLRAKAIAYDMLMLEQKEREEAEEKARKEEEARLEKERKEEEKRQTMISKAKEKVARYERKLNSHNALGRDLEQKLMRAEIELEALMDDGKEVA